MNAAFAMIAMLLLLVLVIPVALVGGAAAGLMLASGLWH
jgi:hypothetical protein